MEELRMIHSLGPHNGMKKSKPFHPIYIPYLPSCGLWRSVRHSGEYSVLSHAECGDLRYGCAATKEVPLDSFPRGRRTFIKDTGPAQVAPISSIRTCTRRVPEVPSGNTDASPAPRLCEGDHGPVCGIDYGAL